MLLRTKFRRRVRVRRTPELVHRTVAELKKEIISYGRNQISEETAEKLALQCVANLDFNDKFQMHRSLSSYAEAITDNFFQRRQKMIKY